MRSWWECYTFIFSLLLMIVFHRHSVELVRIIFCIYENSVEYSEKILQLSFSIICFSCCYCFFKRVHICTSLATTYYHLLEEHAVDTCPITIVVNVIHSMTYMIRTVVIIMPRFVHLMIRPWG
jgi:hypothetical protein